MKFRAYPDRDMMMFSLADQLASDLNSALRQNDRASFSVPGGTSPGPIFDLLAGLALEWDRITIFPNDERWVPEDHARSNARLIRQRLLVNRAKAATFVPLYADTPEPEAAVERLATALSSHLPISVLLLGMGTDMHTASLFPGADRLPEALSPDAPILLPMRADAASEPRITLSARVLADAMAIHILITGDEKRAALEQAATLPPEVAPVRAVLANATVHWAE